jgi:hypothetical protein
MKKPVLLFLFIVLVIGSSCRISLSTSGASIPPAMKTVSVQYFPNRASIVLPSLSQQFTDALKDKIMAQSSLQLVNGTADARFEGEIKGYDVKYVGVQGNNQPAQNRLTLTINVKFTNKIDPKLSFESSFSRYKDYSSNLSPNSVQDELNKQMIDELTEDIFNKAFVNW